VRRRSRIKHKRARLPSGNGLRKRSPYIRRRAPLCPLCHFAQSFFLLDALNKSSAYGSAQSYQRGKQRLDGQRHRARDRKNVLPARVETCRRLTQTNLKFILWLRACWFPELPLTHFLPALRRLYQFPMKMTLL
jgi:hypothetical protein